MKNKTRRRLKKGMKKLGASIPGGNAGAATLGALSIGGLIAAVVTDSEVRSRARALAHATLDRALDLMSGVTGERPSHEDEEEEEQPAQDRKLKHAH